MYSYSASARPRVSRRMLITLVIASAVACVFMATAAQSAFASFSCITLTPATATNQLPQQSSHTVTATVRTTYDPVGHPNNQTHSDYATWWLWYDFYAADYPGQDKSDVYKSLYPQICNTPGAPTLPLQTNAPVTFSIPSGPNASTPTKTVNTDANGEATFTWFGSNAGTDTVQASVPHFYDPANNSSFGDPANVTAIKNWLPPITPPTPDTPVTAAGVPSAVVTVPKTCQKRKFYISSSSAGGSVKKIVLKIDGKTAKVSRTAATASGKKFLINTGAYSSGTHKIALTTYFTNGAKVIKTGKFKLCSVRTSQRRVSPQFTG